MSKSRFFDKMSENNDNESKSSYILECDAFSKRNEQIASYLQRKDSLNSKEYANYNEYVCTINVLNAALNENIKKVEEWMNKLGKTHDFMIKVDFVNAPINPYAGVLHQSLGGRLSRSLFEVINQYISISTSFKTDCLELLSSKFAPESNARNTPA